MCYHSTVESLQEKIKAITGNKRQFILMRVAGMESGLALNIVNISRGTYNSWFKNEEFNLIYRELSALMQEHRQEAVQMLRKGNQLEAVLLEGKIIQKLNEELDSGDYVLAKTNLGREVYSKLVTDLDATPKIQISSWQQRIDRLQQFLPGREEEKIIDAEFSEISSESEEHQEGKLISEGESPNDESTP